MTKPDVGTPRIPGAPSPPAAHRPPTGPVQSASGPAEPATAGRPRLDLSWFGGRRAMALLVAVAIVDAGIIGYFVSDARDKVYTAESKILLGQPGAEDRATLRTDEAQRLVATEADALQRPSTFMRAAEDPALGADAGTLAQHVMVRTDDLLVSLVVSAEGDTPERASARANGVAEAYRAAQQESAAATVEAEISGYTRRIEELKQAIVAAEAVLAERPNDRASQASLSASIGEQVRLRSAVNAARNEAQELGTVREVVPAQPPTSPTRPRPLQDAALTALVAALLLSGFSLRNRLRRSSTAASLERAREVLGVPLLADFTLEELDDAVDDGRLEFVAERTGLVTSSRARVLVTAPPRTASSSLMAEQLASTASALRGDRVALEERETATGDHEAELAALTVVSGPPLARRGQVVAVAADTDTLLLVVEEGTTDDDLAEAVDVLSLLALRPVGFVFITGVGPRETSLLR